MSKLVVSQFMTIDGVIEDPGGGEPFERGGWAFQFERGPEGDRFKFDEVMAAGALLLGRVTYEGFARAWPQMDGDDFGRKMNSMPKYVVSSTLQSADWENSTILRGDPAQEITKLKEQVDGDILLNGSARLAQGLAELGLVDEYRLMLYPVLLGAGKRLFADTSAATSLRATDVRQVGEDGVAILTYVPAT